jgi:RimJ/RimL family protein N-acetyltransferase
MDALTIRAVEPADHAAFFDYLNDHVSDNGKDGTALFQPMPRSQKRIHESKLTAFADALLVELGQPGWRRASIATAADGAIAGHIDLRARPEPAAFHRALLGMGVHRDFRRRGLGAQLIAAAVDWALVDTGLEWIDLEVLSVNEAACRLYARNGFATIGEVADMFRIDGAELAYTFMTRRLRAGSIPA